MPRPRLVASAEESRKEDSRTFELPPDVQRYPTQPTLLLNDKFLSHLRETNQPETFPGLYRQPVARDEKFEILQKFQVERKWRPDKDLVPCVMCSPNAPKFLDGRLVWLVDLEVIAIIGRECADKETSHAAEQSYTERRDRWRDEGILLEKLPRVDEMIAAFQSLKSAAEEAERIHRKLNNEASYALRSLRDIKNKRGGLLEVVIEVDDDNDNDWRAEGPKGFRTSLGGGDVRTASFGMIAGQAALVWTFKPSRRINTAIQRLGYHVVEDEEDGIQKIGDMSRSEQRDTVQTLAWASKEYEKLRQTLSDFADFFTATNFSTINKWGTHPDNRDQLSLSTSTQGNHRVFEIRGLAGHVRIVVRHELYVPDDIWPRFKIGI